MKKLLALSAIALLAACSQSHHNHKGHDHHYGKEAHSKNPALAQAMKECHSTIKENKDMVAFEKCLKEKGFEKPADHPKANGMHKHKDPALSKAMKECHKGVKSKKDSAKFEACLKEKGFEKPANHPKVKEHH
ncbi:hypothetical protein [Mannheimia granulomatis]|uniref:hypothetical protein n=1 Tax=Mannheimia granulomatis TaxID=85402 RepID=UPI00067DF528|nr:hypothetical protein [Mannheimia granulomatis]QLB18420.1 hypothetical protein A6B41_02640 [Mannheimia granulomatis]